MITLTGCGYTKGENVVVGRCYSCGASSFTPLSIETVMKCECGQTTYDRSNRLPLHYLKSQKCPMIIYKATHIKKKKPFIGVIVTADTSRPTQQIWKELQYVRDFRLVGINPELKKDLSAGDIMENFEIEHLTTVNSLIRAGLEEKLNILKHKALKPNGYNTCAFIKDKLKRI